MIKKSTMQKDVQPQFNSSAEIHCACGNKQELGSTEDEMEVELCSACHPAFSDEQEDMVDTTGRIEKFKQKVEKSKAKQSESSSEESEEEN